MRNELGKIKKKKAAGPKDISSGLLRSYADQLCGIVGYVFNMSLKLGRVPELWKPSCVVPVQKKRSPHMEDFNSFRVAADVMST